MANLGPDGHPIPDKQGVVGAEMKPVVLKKPVGESKTVAHGQALDAHGNVIDQTAERAAAEAAKP